MQAHQNLEFYENHRPPIHRQLITYPPTHQSPTYQLTLK